MRVEIENFKPYKKVLLPSHDSKNSNLAEGLFLIHGNNSMGKTSFVQGMLWGLLGDGLMRDQKRKSLVKVGESTCKVDIIFDLSGTLYRISRKLVLKKPKDPIVESDFNEEAVLSKKDKEHNAKFVPITNRSKPVNEEVERMLGVTADVIESTVYIRQKDVDRLALADPRELRELIMILFGLDEFERVKKDLANMSCNLQDSLDILKEEVGGLNSEKKELAKERRQLEEKEQVLNEVHADLKMNKYELLKIPSEDILIKVRTNETEIKTKTNNLQLINNLITEKTSYMKSQEQRIESLRKRIADQEGKKAHVEYTLEQLPSKENLHMLNELLSEIRIKETQVRTLVNRSSITLDLDAIVQPGNIKHMLDNILNDIEALKKKNQQAYDSIEYLRRISTSTEVLSGIKKNSIRYIKEEDKCPVCNKPIDNKENMILGLGREMRDIERNYKDINLQVRRAVQSHSEIEREIEAKREIRTFLETLFTVSEDLVNLRELLLSMLSQYSVKSVQDFLSCKGFSTIGEMISQVSKLEIEIANCDDNIHLLNRQIEEENCRYKKYEEQLSQSEDQMNNIIDDLTQLKNKQQEHLRNLFTVSLDDLIHRFECKTIDEILIKRKTMEAGITTKQKLLDMVGTEIHSLREEIKNRESTLVQLSQKETIILQKENELRHVKYLRGEIDGFISNYVVQGRMLGALRQSTNDYLTQLTQGRYTIDNITSKMRRIRGGMESHGLEMTLMDSKDNMIKNKDQLSGGDETSLGLALRIAISKLMGRIRPFKNSEKKPPLINSIIMDEPMASLDSSRRRILVNILIQDKSFKQIFLTTHNDLEFGDYNSIMVSEDENGKRLVDYTPLQL
ncbi:MAG TPA: SMC family ATPase [Nitrososphaeraceae archaeon]|nr:SMC family ATPase [Nitrososphaeraceae archaeon]